MTLASLADVSTFLDARLAIDDIPDYDRALNGLQLANLNGVHRVAAAVDFSLQAIREAVGLGADLLLVHHGMFWAGLQPVVASHFDRLQLAINHGLAVYSSHLPLDYHAELGNNTQLARALSLSWDGRFGRHGSLEIGVTGTADLDTLELLDRVRAFSEPLGAHVVASSYLASRQTRRWAIVTGAGASSETLREAAERGIDTLIVGEGPHHTVIDARERDIVVIYAGHYATETLGVQALAAELGAVFSLPWTFVHVPTGL